MNTEPTTEIRICGLCGKKRIDPDISPEQKASLSEDELGELMFLGGKCCKNAIDEDDMPGIRG